MPRRKLPSSFNVETIVQMRLNGMTTKDIAEQLGCSAATVANYTRDYDIQQIRHKSQELRCAHNLGCRLTTVSLDVDGEIASYHIDTRDGSVILLESDNCFISGNLSLSDLHKFIAELRQLEVLLHAQTGRSAASSAADDQAIPDPR